MANRTAPSVIHQPHLRKGLDSILGGDLGLTANGTTSACLHCHVASDASGVGAGSTIADRGSGACTLTNDNRTSALRKGPFGVSEGEQILAPPQQSNNNFLWGGDKDITLIANDDIVLEFIFKSKGASDTGWRKYFSCQDNTAPGDGDGILFYHDTTAGNYRHYFYITDSAAADKYILTTLAADTYYHGLFSMNGSGTTTSDVVFMINGVDATGTGDLTKPDDLTFPIDGGPWCWMNDESISSSGLRTHTSPYDIGLCYSGIWIANDWLADGAAHKLEMERIAAERFYALTGGAGQFVDR